MSPILCYDPVGRVVAHAAPEPHLGEGGVRPVAPGDLGRQRHGADPTRALDPDVGGLLRAPRRRRVPADLVRRSGPTARSAPHEQAAARRSGRSHADTPALAYARLARPDLPDRGPQPCSTAAPTRRWRRSSSARASCSTSRATSAAVIDALGPHRHALRLRHARPPRPPASMEAGERWMLADVAGQAALRLGQPRTHRLPHRATTRCAARCDRGAAAGDTGSRRCGACLIERPSTARGSPTRGP